jgi:hypothetical protein
LRPADLDPDQCLVFLREKGENVRWQLVSPTLMSHLQAHAADRHAPVTRRLLRDRDGRAITYRRYDHLWTRIGRRLPWAATQQISTHWFRPHHPDLGRTQLRLRRRPRLRRPHRRWQRTRRHRHLRPRHLPRSRAALAALTGEPHSLA